MRKLLFTTAALVPLALICVSPAPRANDDMPGAEGKEYEAWFANLGYLGGFRPAVMKDKPYEGAGPFQLAHIRAAPQYDQEDMDEFYLVQLRSWRDNDGGITNSTAYFNVLVPRTPDCFMPDTPEAYQPNRPDLFQAGDFVVITKRNTIQFVTRPVLGKQRDAVLASDGGDSPPESAPAATATPTPMRHDRKNTARPNDRPLDGLPTLPDGYVAYHIQTLKILSADPRLHNVPPTPAENIEPPKEYQDRYPVIANGGFTTTQDTEDPPEHRYAVASLMLDGKVGRTVDKEGASGQPKTNERGGLAVLKDGSIVLGRQSGRRPNQIQRRFGEDGNEVIDFMGGGALLVDDGKPTTRADVFKVQQFKAPGPQQFHACAHTLVGIRDGQAFLIISPGKATGWGIQKELQEAGFGTVVKFDGGAGFYWHDKNEKVRRNATDARPNGSHTVLWLAITTR